MKTVLNSVVTKLVIVWTLSLVIAFVVADQTAFSLFQIAGVLVMLGSLGILTLQYHQAVRLPNLYQEETEAMSDSPGGEGASSRVTATSGLSPTERQVQNEMIRTAYRQFSDEPFRFLLSRQAPHLVRDVADTMEDVDEETVERVWRFSKDDGFFERRPGGNSLRLTPKGVWRAEELGEEVLLDEEVQDEIMDVLMAAYRDSPSYPRIDRNDLIAAVGFPEEEIDQNLWLLEEKGFVETQAYINQRDVGYEEVEITQLGRSVM